MENTNDETHWYTKSTNEQWTFLNDLPKDVAIECPECGEPNWQQRQTGTFTENHILFRTADGRYIQDWHNQQTTTEESFDWTCSNCGTIASSPNLIAEIEAINEKVT